MVRAGDLKSERVLLPRRTQGVLGFHDRSRGCAEQAPLKSQESGAPGMASHKWSEFVLSLQQGSQAGRARECREGGRGSRSPWGRHEVERMNRSFKVLRK